MAPCNRATAICFSSCSLALLLIVYHNAHESAADDEWFREQHQLRSRGPSTGRIADEGGFVPLTDVEQLGAAVVIEGRIGTKRNSGAHHSVVGKEELVYDERVYAPPLNASILDFTRPNFLNFVNPPRRMDAKHFTCPGYRIPSQKSADGKSIHEHVVKYSRYVNQYCNKSGMLQMNVDFKTYGWILDKLAHMARIKPNDHIFDWGCGCGTMLNYLHLRYNTTGIGIDITENAIEHAKFHAQPGQQFCHMDGADMRRFPSEGFDAIVSWATLYHIRRTLVQCEVVHHMIRMLKPGGIAYVGHLRTEKTQEYWKKGRCRHENATIVRYRDYKTFHQPSWKRHQFFSVIVTKHTRDGRAVSAPNEEGN